ncbi:MAG: peptidoglycan DD-metalloendopeptidase family protein [Acidobacteriota bacterium]|nr:peptidoglycan DD-metalloendopeptidase family protein [Acidobacteriota bacterium]
MIYPLYVLLILIAQISFFSPGGAVKAQTPLKGIQCGLEPRRRVDSFKMPVLPVQGKSWRITNDFGNGVTNKDIPGLPTGTWQHTGVDYLLGGSSAASQNQPIYAAANGIVVFSTKSEANPIPARGGLVIIRHLPPPGAKFLVVRYNGKAGAYEEFEAEEVFSYYLHLDAGKITVKTGDNVEAGGQIAQLYSSQNVAQGKYAYVPHLHFEVWSVCSKTELNGYEPGGTLKNSLRKPVIDPISFLSNVKIKGKTATTAPSPAPNPSPSSPTPPRQDIPIIKTAPVPTLFLLDTSGSMSENNKMEQARAAGLDALQELRRSGASNAPTAVRIFAGDCNERGTRSLSAFTPNLNQTEAVFRSGIPRPDGGTPLPQGKDAAIGEMIAYLKAHPEIKGGRIILLSDGQSTCGEIRPAGVFSRRDFAFHRSNIRFLTVGFDVPAGSAAERDLQFLASETGGKYYSASDRSQLIRAFQKHLRVFAPRPCRMSDAGFAAGVAAFEDYNYPAALGSFRAFVAANPTDSCGIYNLALALEANDRYRSAAEMYRKYLEALPSAVDRAATERHIAQLLRDYAEQFRYFIAVAGSDLDYLKRYYQSVFNRSNQELAIEFSGFVREKREFYANLPDILETDVRWLKNDSRDLADSIDTLAERTKLETFDRDAVSLLTIPIAQLEDLIGRLNDYAANNFR